MDSIINALIQALTSTQEFKQLKSAMDALRQNPQLLRRITAFEEKQQSFPQNASDEQYRRISNELSAEYNALSLIPEAARYFNAADKFNQYAGSIMDNIMSQVWARV